MRDAFLGSRQFGVLWLMNANRVIQQDVRPDECSVTWATTRHHVPSSGVCDAGVVNPSRHNVPKANHATTQVSAPVHKNSSSA